MVLIALKCLFRVANGGNLESSVDMGETLTKTTMARTLFSAIFKLQHL